MQIGVPERFSTPRADIDVVTRAARAPALLTAYQVNSAGEKKQIDLHLQTGTRTVMRGTMANVCQGPFRTVSLEDPADQDHILPHTANVGYFIHSFTISCRLAAANTGTRFGFAWTDDAPLYPTGIVSVDTVPSVAGVVNMAGVLDVYTKPGDGVHANMTGTYAGGVIAITYAPVSGVM